MSWGIDDSFGDLYEFVIGKPRGLQYPGRSNDTAKRLGLAGVTWQFGGTRKAVMWVEESYRGYAAPASGR